MTERVTDMRRMHYGVLEPDYSRSGEPPVMISVCYEDGSLWPCDAGALLEEVDAALAENARLRTALEEANKLVSGGICVIGHKGKDRYIRLIGQTIDRALSASPPAPEEAPG